MKKKIALCFAAAVVLFLLSALVKDFIFDSPQSCLETVSRSLGRDPDRAAELLNGNVTLVYRINYLSLIPMGTLKLSRAARENGPVFTLEASSEKSIAEPFVHADARIETTYDGRSNMPSRYSEITQVNGKLKTKDIEFDRENQIATYGDMKVKITEDTYDPVGAFLAASGQEYPDDKEHTIRLLSKKDLYLMKSRKIRQAVRLMQLSIDVKRENLTSSHGAAFTVWMMTGKSPIPLIFKSWTPGGFVSVVLDKIEMK